MRKLKWVGIVLAVIIAGFLLFLKIAPLPAYPVALHAVNVPTDAAAIERGTKLANVLCVECHYNPKTGKLSGRFMQDLPREFGEAWSMNITQDKEKGIGSWTDSEIAWLVRTGIHPKTSRYVPPWMVKLPNAADSDIGAIIAFLRGNDPRVAADKSDRPEQRPSLLAKFLARVAFKPFRYPSAKISVPPIEDKVAHGQYLANSVFGCFACHSADFKTMNEMEPPKSGGYYGGGNMMPDFTGQAISTANITPDKEHGIGAWSLEDFTRAMKKGLSRSGKSLRYPMPQYSELSDKEIEAIYSFLKTVPPLATPRKPFQAGPRTSDPGEVAYVKYGCDSCHASDGNGMADLRGISKRYPQREMLKARILTPKKFAPLTRMPEWQGIIDDKDLEPLLDYVTKL